MIFSKLLTGNMDDCGIVKSLSYTSFLINYFSKQIFYNSDYLNRCKQIN